MDDDGRTEALAIVLCSFTFQSSPFSAKRSRMISTVSAEDTSLASSFSFSKGKRESALSTRCGDGLPYTLMEESVKFCLPTLLIISILSRKLSRTSRSSRPMIELSKESAERSFFNFPISRVLGSYTNIGLYPFLEKNLIFSRCSLSGLTPEKGILSDTSRR